MAETVVAPTYGDSAAQELLKPKPKEALAGFLELIRGLRRASSGATVESIIEAALDESGLMQFYVDKCGSGAGGMGWDEMRLTEMRLTEMRSSEMCHAACDSMAEPGLDTPYIYHVLWVSLSLQATRMLSTKTPQEKTR